MMTLANIRYWKLLHKYSLRFICIVHRRNYNKLFSTKKTILFCFTGWILGFFVDLPNNMGWSGHSYDIHSLACLWSRHADHGFNIYFSTICVIGKMFLIGLLRLEKHKFYKLLCRPLLTHSFFLFENIHFCTKITI